MRAVEQKIGKSIERKPNIPGSTIRPDGTLPYYRKPHRIPVEIKTLTPSGNKSISDLASDRSRQLSVKLVNGELCPSTLTNKQLQRYIVALEAPYAYLGVYLNNGGKEEVEVIKVFPD